MKSCCYEVESTSLEEAIEMVNSGEIDLDFPLWQDYVDDSFEVDIDATKENYEYEKLLKPVTKRFME